MEQDIRKHLSTHIHGYIKANSNFNDSRESSHTHRGVTRREAKEEIRNVTENLQRNRQAGKGGGGQAEFRMFK